MLKNSSSNPRLIEKALKIIREYGAKRIILFGSAAKDAPHCRDLDFAVSGVKASHFFILLGRLIREIDFPIDLIDIDDVDDYFAKKINEEGKELH